MQFVAQSKMNFATFIISVLYVAGAGGISVKWGTSGGPIIPPTPAPPTPPPQPPFRAPAPAWEDNTGDIPNPNPYRAPVFPQLAHYFPTRTPPTVQAPSTPRPAATHQPSGLQPASPPRYTHIVYSPKLQPLQSPASTTTLSPIKSFISAYAQPTKAPQTQNTQQQQNNNQQPKQEPYRPEPNYQNLESRNDNFYGNHNQVPELGVKYVPGYGYKYFTAEQDQDPRKYDRSYKNDYHNKHNAIETNDIFGEKLHQNDLDLTYEKQMALRVKKSPTQQFYVPHQVYQPIQYYHQPQFFFPANRYQGR